MPNLRKKLNLPVENYTIGKSRSDTASRVNKRGKDYENIIFELLIKKFDEKFIHIEKPLTEYSSILNYHYHNSKNRYDFYVYAKPNNFAIDVFGTNDSRGVTNNMNAKEGKYKKSDLEVILYFIYFGKNIDDIRVKKWIDNKKNKIPSTWKILNFGEFQKELEKYYPYKAI